MENVALAIIFVANTIFTVGALIALSIQLDRARKRNVELVKHLHAYRMLLAFKEDDPFN